MRMLVDEDWVDRDEKIEVRDPYSLHAGIFTRDIATALKATENLEVGGG